MDEAIELYNSGLNTREVANKFSIKRGTVSKWMRDLGISRRRGGGEGSKNPAWNNNATIRNFGERFTKRYLKWKSIVLKRDEFMCCLCGYKGNRLHVHHILRFALYPEKRTDINNGVTLCRECHIDLHKFSNGILAWTK